MIRTICSRVSSDFKRLIRRQNVFELNAFGRPLCDTPGRSSLPVERVRDFLGAQNFFNQSPTLTGLRGKRGTGGMN